MHFLRVCVNTTPYRGGYTRVTKRFFAVLLALAMLAAAGCSKPKPTDNTGGGAQGGDPNAVVDGGTLNLSMFSAPKGVFNPVLYEDQYDSWILDLTFNGLLRLNDKLEYICDLCEKFDVSPDNKTVTFQLRDGLKWHDGQPVSTTDVAFTFRTMLDPDYTGVRTGDFAALAGVQKMLDERDANAKQVDEKKMTAEDAAKKNKEAWQVWLNGPGKQAINVIDAKQVSFTTDEPYAPLIQSLAYSIIPAHVFKDIPVAKMADAEATKTKPIGTGPFKFVEYKPDQYVKLERNESFHLGKPHIQTIIYKIVNQDVAIGQLKAGEIDYMPRINPKDAVLLNGDKNIKTYERADFGYQYMGINFDNPILKDKNVRQAIMYAINRKAMVDSLLEGHGTVMNSHMPPALWAYDPSSLNAYGFDSKKASELLAAAGWKDKNAEGYLTKDGKVFEFTLKYPSGNKVRESSAPLIQANLKDVGIKVNLQMMEFATLSTTVFDKRDADAWLMGWSLSVDPDPGSIFLPDNKWGKVTGWTNQRNEQLIKDGVKVLKVTERKPLYVEWAKILNDELPYIFLYSQNEIDALRTDKVMGAKPDARGSLWNLYEWSIPKAKQG
jgi:peptide/nickel transport system substrate-binding protein